VGQKRYRFFVNRFFVNSGGSKIVPEENTPEMVKHYTTGAEYSDIVPNRIIVEGP